MKLLLRILIAAAALGVAHVADLRNRAADGSSGPKKIGTLHASSR